MLTNVHVFRGAVAGSNTAEATERLEVLRDEISRLEEHEKKLDLHKQVRKSYHRSLIGFIMLEKC